MSKVIVNIISSESPLPAYLFVKEKYVLGDQLLFLSSKEGLSNLKHIAKVLQVPSEQVMEIIFKEDEDFTYERICRRIRAEIKENAHYYVNLAGGTRYMALAVQQAFSQSHADFFYTNLRDNNIVKSIFDDSIYDNDDYVYPVLRRMSIAEYLSLHQIKHDADNRQTHLPIRSESYVQKFFTLYVENRLNDMDFRVMEALRLDYRNYIRSGQYLKISEIEQGRVSRCQAIPELSQFLDFIDFVPARKGALTKEEIDFLTGGWFEEHCYYLAKREFAPDDLLIGVHVACPGVDHDNELDVVFTKDNALHVIECKSGISSNKLFNEIVYKACALKEALLGLMCHYYLFSLKRDNAQEDFRKIAHVMSVDFWGRDKLVSMNQTPARE